MARAQHRSFGACVLFVALLLGGAIVVPAHAATPGPPFTRDLKSALETSERTGQPVVVAFVATWCPICTEMKRKVWSDPAILAHRDDFIWVLIDIDRKLSTAREYGIEGVPQTLFLDSRGQRQASLLGYVDASELDAALARFGNSSSEEEPSDEDNEAAETAPYTNLTYVPKGYRSDAICFSNVGYGPLKLYAQSPFQALRLTIRPRAPSTLGKGQYEGSFWATWVNVFDLENDVGDPDNQFFLDFESLQTVLALSYGITDTLEIEGEFQTRSRFGGHMDGFIEGFHDLFGIDQGGRLDVPRDDFSIHLTPEDGREAVSLDSRDRGVFSQTLGVSFQHNITCGTSRLPALAYSVSARYEMNDDDAFGDSNDLDVGFSASVSRRFGKFYAYGTLGYAWFGRDNFRGLELADNQWTILVAGEWRIFARQSLIVQLLVTEGQVEDFGAFSEQSNEITLGYKWEVRDRGILEVALIENIISFDNSPDLGFHAGYSQRF
jgi:thioredoxin-related protein